jgi:hypothetical protein
VAVANVDHLLFVGLYRLGPQVLAAILHTVAGAAIVTPPLSGN